MWVYRNSTAWSAKHLRVTGRRKVNKLVVGPPMTPKVWQDGVSEKMSRQKQERVTWSETRVWISTSPSKCVALTSADKPNTAERVRTVVTHVAMSARETVNKYMSKKMHMCLTDLNSNFIIYAFGRTSKSHGNDLDLLYFHQLKLRRRVL